MQIEERTSGDVVVLDLKGKITLGEGDELLKDKVNSLVNQGHKKIVLNLAGVPYIDSAGLGEVVRTYTTVSRQGGSLKLLNLTKRITDLLSITKLLTVFETYRRALDGAHHFFLLRGVARYFGQRSIGSPNRPSVVDLSPSGAVDEEPSRLRRPAVRTTAGRSGRHRRRPRGLRRVLPVVGRRLHHQRHLGPGQRPTPSVESPAADRVGSAAGEGGGSGSGRDRRRRAGRRERARPAVPCGRGRISDSPVALLGSAQTHRDHRRADAGDRIRPAGGGRRSRGQRRNQPLAAGLHDPAGAVHGAGEAASRDRAARRRRREPSADSRR